MYLAHPSLPATRTLHMYIEYDLHDYTRGRGPNDLIGGKWRPGIFEIRVCDLEGNALGSELRRGSDLQYFLDLENFR